MYKKYIKRWIDIILSVIALPFLGILFIVLAPIIVSEDRGPIFYNAERLGYKGKIFKMYKFRSMKVNAPDIRNEDGSTYNGDRDPRVTRIGRVLRKTSIDEIPQILNVLKGDMSWIGPRAHLTTHFTTYEALDERQKKRLTVRPGITGYNQAYYRNSVNLEEKIKNDIFYVDHLTFLLDIKVFLKTIDSVIRRKNIYVEQNENKGRKKK